MAILEILQKVFYTHWRRPIWRIIQDAGFQLNCRLKFHVGQCQQFLVISENVSKVEIWTYTLVLLMTIFAENGWPWLFPRTEKCVKPFYHSATFLNGANKVWDLE